MTTTIRKALAYITRGQELLIFRQPLFPEAGLQVPGGTIREGEEPEAAALREAIEETGLTDLEIMRFLGEQVREMTEAGRGEIHHRYFYQLTTKDPRSEWEWHDEEIKIQLFFVNLTAVPELTTEQDYLLRKHESSTADPDE